MGRGVRRTGWISAEIHCDFIAQASSIFRSKRSYALFFSAIEGLTLWRGIMARKCHMQETVPSLFSSVSSSGGGLPGRPGLERVSGRSLFGADFRAVFEKTIKNAADRFVLWTATSRIATSMSSLVVCSIGPLPHGDVKRRHPFLIVLLRKDRRTG